ncbi:TrkH family potassium uptake protein [Paenibacillus turpanensis]|uniref:TrkH family potassium uptake protein n=1 Tax=Paenibacillus turpanensis TaxID=2689078 RepID=UPI001FB5A61A|nr:potassium transporter TrkG [Paenibacillus turpanensis]
MTPTQLIVFGYLASTLVFSILLYLPISLYDGVRLSPLDALFTATSAISVTGLTVVSTAETFNSFGKIVLLLSFQVGGIGIMTLGTFLWLLLGRNIGLSHRRLMMIDQNRSNLSGLVQLAKIIIMLILVIEAIGALLLGLYFKISGHFEDWSTAFVHGVFHSISSFTNAGFDIFGDSLYRFSDDYVVQTITILLLVLGAIGFPVLMELREYVISKHERFRFSLYTKTTSIMFILLIAFGMLSILVIEDRLFFADIPWHQKMYFALFNSVTTRSGGLATADISEFSVPTQMVLSFLMFVGASPSSVGGGIRTTTFAVIVLTVVNYAMGRQEVRTFHRRIKQEDIIKSFVVFTVATLLVAGSAVLLDIFESGQVPFSALIFEVCSAFGTSGLSLGITPGMSSAGKIVLILLMFIGRIGVLSLLFMFRSNRKQVQIRYPKEDLIIG